MTWNEVAERLSVDRSTLYRWRQEPGFPAPADVEAIERWLANRAQHGVQAERRQRERCTDSGAGAGARAECNTDDEAPAIVTVDGATATTIGELLQLERARASWLRSPEGEAAIRQEVRKEDLRRCRQFMCAFKQELRLGAWLPKSQRRRLKRVVCEGWDTFEGEVLRAMQGVAADSDSDRQ